jgi:hypothetical protein
MQTHGFMELTCPASGGSRKKVAGYGQCFSVFLCPLAFSPGLRAPRRDRHGHGSGVATAAHAVPNRRERPTGTRQRAKPGFQVVRVAQSRYGAVRRYGQGGITGRSPPICPGMTWRLTNCDGSAENIFYPAGGENIASDICFGPCTHRREPAKPARETSG